MANVKKDVEISEMSLTAVKTKKQCRCFRKQFVTLPKWHVGLSYDWEILLLGTYSQEMKMYTHKIFYTNINSTVLVIVSENNPTVQQMNINVVYP